MTAPDETKVNALRRRKTKEPANIADSFTQSAAAKEPVPTKRLNVEVPVELHTFLKMKAARESTEVRKLVVDALLVEYGQEFE